MSHLEKEGGEEGGSIQFFNIFFYSLCFLFCFYCSKNLRDTHAEHEN